MGTVLFAWELGGGLGHIGPMKLLADRLSRWGHDCVFAVKDVVSARPHLGKFGRVLQAPVASANKLLNQPFGVGSFADILASAGFSEVAQLEALAESWADLFGLVEPGLLIADFSPVALLAARGLIPSVVVGYGFCLPPHEIMSFPPFRDDIPSTAIESTIVANMAVIAEKRHASPLRSAPSLFRAHYSHCFSLPLLDPYAAYRRTPALGPIEPMPRFVPPPGESRLFAYLRADSADTPDLIAALSQLGLSVDIHLRGEGRALAEFARRRGLTAHAEPPRLAELLPRVSAVLSHGSSGIAHAALLAGRPQILLPQQLEQSITATMLERLGAGIVLARQGSATDVAGAIREAVSDDRLQRACAEIARQVGGTFYPDMHLEQLVEVCNGSLAYSSERRFLR